MNPPLRETPNSPSDSIKQNIILFFEISLSLWQQNRPLRIVTFVRIQDFGSKYPNADIALRDWYTKVKQCNWETLGDVKTTYNHADYVGNNRIVFNIKGNKYRLVAIVIYASQKVYIRFIGTHKQYDKIDCTTI